VEEGDILLVSTGRDARRAETDAPVAAHDDTSVPVAAGAVAAVVWAISNPRRGIVEPDELDFEDCLSTATPYLGRLVGEFTTWTPLQGRGELFDEDLDVNQPWQLRNVRSRQWRS